MRTFVKSVFVAVVLVGGTLNASATVSGSDPRPAVARAQTVSGSDPRPAAVKPVGVLDVILSFFGVSPR
ncbi:hypothetical protein GCM10022270_08050 [Terriglobus aquaticus]